MGCPSRKVLMSQRATVDRLSSRRKYYAYSTLKAPDKGEVGGSSPPRPTIEITSKYAAILTFPLFGDLPQKTVLSFRSSRLEKWRPGRKFVSTVQKLRSSPALRLACPFS